MAKDSYYFPHDYNARNDRKIAALIQKHKAAGYGVFWITCEMMHEEDGNIEFDEITFGAIAKDSNESVDFVKTVISDSITEFKLFKREDDIVLSGRVSRNLEHRKEISKSRSEAGKRGANVKQMQANAEQNQAKKGKEIKETKERESNGNAHDIKNSNLFRQPKIPSKQQVLDAILNAGGNKEMAKSFWQKHESTGWFINGSPIVDHIALAERFVGNWKSNEIKEEPQKTAPTLKNLNNGN